MISSLVATKGVLTLWAGKGAGLMGGIPGNSLTRLNLGLSLGLAEGGEFQKAMRLLGISPCVGWKAGRAINLGILCRHSRILEAPCSRTSELDQTRRKLPSGHPGLEHPFKPAVVHLTSPPASAATL